VTPDAPSAERLKGLLARREFPAKFGQILDEFLQAYRRALSMAGLNPDAYDHLSSRFIERLEAQLTAPFAFEPYHRQVTEPFDYYTFGLDFLRPLIDKTTSSVSGRAHLDRGARQLAEGDNVIFLANHQTEGDPQAISLLLEDTHADLGRRLIFVAGERVTTDPLAVPFSMGRNLLCIYSKRHIEHPPEKKAERQRHNQKTMERMRALLCEGGHAIYVAPSGGRDRVNTSGVVEIAPFDPQSVEMIYVMARRSDRPAHFYPMALDTYAFLPPPDAIQIELGEPRRIARAGIHLAIGAELDMEALGRAAPVDKRAQRVARAQAIWETVASMAADLRRPAAR
jgi:glycerol-3-phosphate O-acyltransferase